MADAFPYVTPADDAVRAGAWTTSWNDGSIVALPEWLPYWDISQELSVVRSVEIDLDRVYDETRIPRTCSFALCVVVASDFEHAACRSTLDATSGTHRADLAFALAGDTLGSSVAISTTLVLRDAAPSIDEPVAWRRGSVMWSDLKRLRLYGDASQFPVTEVDFGDCGLDAGAPWFLDVGSELELPAMGGVQLLLNSRFPLVVAAAREIDPARTELAVIRSQLFSDIGRTLVEHALSHDDLDQEWPDDSLGSVLLASVRSRFSEPLVDLRTLRANDPATWAARTASVFGLLREPLR